MLLARCFRSRDWRVYCTITQLLGFIKLVAKSASTHWANQEKADCHGVDDNDSSDLDWDCW